MGRGGHRGADAAGDEEGWPPAGRLRAAGRVDPGRDGHPAGDADAASAADTGHTAGHLVFLDADSSLLFAGDHILPHITPSIGFELVRQELPLGDYLDSLRLVREHPEMRLLPAHGPVADSTHVRVDELLDHHRRRLDETEHALAQDEATAAEVAARMGLDPAQPQAVRDGHLQPDAGHRRDLRPPDVLVRDGRLRSSTVDGVARYRA
ncbi:MBL fold metallo-hydrolase [Kutzneria kofuensis]|uniref:MBL fold metallo-hydrolase n=1 Tax=Kutzneria kofuensis TaxID=103725 RepID=UPI003CD0BCB5